MGWSDGYNPWAINPRLNSPRNDDPGILESIGFALAAGLPRLEAPLDLAISNVGLGGGQIRRVETGHNRIRVLS